MEKRRRRGAKKGKSGTNPTSQIIYGIHSVTAALSNPNRRIFRLLATRNGIEKVLSAAKRNDIDVEQVDPGALSRVCGAGAVHQGVACEVAPLEAADVGDLEPDGLVVVLDQVSDPHNIGAIVRTCAAFDAKALVVQARTAPLLSPVLAKTASGGLEFVPVIEVTNLARAIETLQKVNFTVIGLDSEADTDMAGVNIPLPLALVLGAEGKGLRQNTRNKCDLLARLDVPGKIKSLNVSNAAAVCMSLLNQSRN